MFYADTLGLDTVIERIEKHSNTLEPQYWEVSVLLRNLRRAAMQLPDFRTCDDEELWERCKKACDLLIRQAINLPI